MKPSETNAAKNTGVNAKLAKRYGQPYNASTMSGGRATEASKRPAVNSNIVNNKWNEAPNDYGKGV